MPASSEIRDQDDWLLLTDAILVGEEALEWVERPGCGGVVGFFGVVRDHADGRTGVTAVEYEAYEAPVLQRLRELAASARLRTGGIGGIVLWHRFGRLVVGETSVAVVVSAPHRAEAFDACRYLIDTLKATLPIWKNEFWDGGSGWSPSGRPLVPVPAGAEHDL